MLGARFGALYFGTCNVKTLRPLRLYVVYVSMLLAGLAGLNVGCGTCV